MLNQLVKIPLLTWPYVNIWYATIHQVTVHCCPVLRLWGSSWLSIASSTSTQLESMWPLLLYRSHHHFSCHRHHQLSQPQCLVQSPQLHFPPAQRQSFDLQCPGLQSARFLVCKRQHPLCYLSPLIGRALQYLAHYVNLCFLVYLMHSDNSAFVSSCFHCISNAVHVHMHAWCVHVDSAAIWFIGTLLCSLHRWVWRFHSLLRYTDDILCIYSHYCCHDHDTQSTLYHSIRLCPRICCLFHCMYLCFPIVSTLLVLPLIGEHSVHSVSPYDYLTCFCLQSPVILCSCPVLFTNTIHLRESVTYITGLTHHTAQLCLPLFIGIPDPPSITPYILL